MVLKYLPAFGLLVLPGLAYSQENKCDSIADCAQKAMEAAYQAKMALQIAMPKGAVLAFDLKECPPGWTAVPGLAGRVVVGAGKGNVDEKDKPLTERQLNKTGSEESHILTREELPNFRPNVIEDRDHSVVKLTAVVPCNNTGCSVVGALTDGFVGGTVNNPVAVEPLGKGDPVSNMPPFHVLLYCERQ